MQERQQALSGCKATGTGVAVVPPSADTGQQVPSKHCNIHCTIHFYLVILWPTESPGHTSDSLPSLSYPPIFSPLTSLRGLRELGRI